MDRPEPFGPFLSRLFPGRPKGLDPALAHWAFVFRVAWGMKFARLWAHNMYDATLNVLFYTVGE